MKKGFTVIEIMVIAALIALVSSLSAVHIAREISNTNEVAAKAALQAISAASEYYAMNNKGKYPLQMSDLIGAKPPYVHKDYTINPQHGYNFACNFTTEGYICSASPKNCGFSGKTIFTVTSAGNFSYASCGRDETSPADTTPSAPEAPSTPTAPATSTTPTTPETGTTTGTDGTTKSGTGFRGCFIATAAYGSPLAKEVGMLCAFRDRYLLTSDMGRALVSLYYKNSPAAAKFISDHPASRIIVRALLRPIVRIAQKLL